MAQGSHLFGRMESMENFLEHFQNRRRNLLTTSDKVTEQEGHLRAEES